MLFLLGKEVFFCDFLDGAELEPESLERLSGLDVLIIDEEALFRPRDGHIEELELRAELLIATLNLALVKILLHTDEIVMELLDVLGKLTVFAFSLELGDCLVVLHLQELLCL